MAVPRRAAVLLWLAVFLVVHVVWVPLHLATECHVVAVACDVVAQSVGADLAVAAGAGLVHARAAENGPRPPHAPHCALDHKMAQEHRREALPLRQCVDQWPRTIANWVVAAAADPGQWTAAPSTGPPRAEPGRATVCPRAPPGA